MSLLTGFRERYQGWRDQRRLRHLESLLIRTEDEDAALRELGGTPARYPSDLHLPDELCAMRARPVRDAVALVNGLAGQMPREALYETAAARLGTSPAELKRELSDYVLRYNEQRERGARPLAIYDPELIPAEQRERLLSQGYLAATGFSTERACRALSRHFGMPVPASAFEERPAEESDASSEMPRPLDRIVEDAVAAYNRLLESGRHGYRRPAAALGLDRETYRDALRERVRAAEASYDDRGGDGRPAIGRFDRGLLRDYDSFADELAGLYAANDRSLAQIATHVAEKYGMRISARHASKLARERLNEQRIRAGQGPIRHRDEAVRTAATPQQPL